MPKPRKESEKNIPDRFDARVGEPWTLAPRFLQLFTALESICIVNEREPISQNLAERITFLIEEDIERRIQLYDELKSLYRDRSKIVHHGYSEIDEWGFKFLANITKMTIIAYLQKYYDLEWSSVTDFAKWVKRMKFS